jgi:hypothetical protein
MRILTTTIQPSYGLGRAIVRWTVDAELAAANPEFFVYRSPDGAQGWERVNDTATSLLELEDTQFRFYSRATIPHYRVRAVLDADPANDIDGGPVGLFAALTRREFAACRRMIEVEYQTIRHDGWPVLHYVPLTKGEVQPGWNQTTGKEETACAGEKDGYGQKYVGGYTTPYYTVLHPRQVGPIVKELRDDGLGVFDQNTIVAKMGPFPRPVSGHLIVHPDTDNRYAVTEKVTPWPFKGTYPISFTAQLELLPREHPAYRLPLPDDFDTWELP